MPEEDEQNHNYLIFTPKTSNNDNENYDPKYDQDDKIILQQYHFMMIQLSCPSRQ